jgi:hypothetical protein
MNTIGDKGIISMNTIGDNAMNTIGGISYIHDCLPSTPRSP